MNSLKWGSGIPLKTLVGVWAIIISGGMTIVLAVVGFLFEPVDPFREAGEAFSVFAIIVLIVIRIHLKGKGDGASGDGGGDSDGGE